MSSKVQVDVLHDELASVTGGHVIDAEHCSPFANELRVFPVLAGPEQRGKLCESCNRFRDCPGIAWSAPGARSSCAEKMPLNKDFGCAWKV